jgi:TetR/AcrR family transcriptional regulator, tetracycline repressor protein
MSRRDEVLQAALHLLDEVGLDDLTVRRLAERLGVAPSALYRHFPSKAALVDAMVEAIAGSAAGPAPTGPWDEQVRALASASRDGMLAHRDGARLMATFATPGPAALESFARFTGLLEAAGLDPEAALVAVDTVVCYVNGFTIEEQTRRPADPTRRTRAERDAGFRAGLDLIIAGVRAAAPAPTTPGRAR